MSDIASEIHKKAIECGYDNCGIISLDELDDYKVYLDERISKIPESRFVYGFYDEFTNLKERFPWAESVIICTIWFGKYKYPKYLQGKYAKSFFLSINTVPDSQEYKKKKSFETFLAENDIRFAGGDDNAPGSILPLRHAAVKVGLGIFRKNNFFYSEKGSYYALEAYVIDKKLELKHDLKIKPCSDKCTVCLESCRTNALCNAYTMNPTRCISLLTTFAGGNLPADICDETIGTWVCGCDDCQDMCPHNKKHNCNEGEDFPGLNDILELLKLENLIEASDEELCEKIIPKTEFHLGCWNVEVLRVCARRALNNCD